MHRLGSVVMMAGLLACAWKTDLLAQDASEGQWGVSQRFQTSSGGYGQVFKLDTTVTYYFNSHVSLGAGVPYYVVNRTIDTDTSSDDGIGNVYVKLGFAIAEAPVRFASSLEIGAPTGDETAGFSTGTVTVDWNNSISVPMERVIPFFNIGLANTVSDTAFFTRPFSSIGFVAHVQGGAEWALASKLGVAASGYAVVPSGEQAVVSRVFQTDTRIAGGVGRPFEIQREIVGDADLARDHGLSTWLSVYPSGNVQFYGGLTRSIRLDLNSVFFGMGWNFGGF